MNLKTKSIHEIGKEYNLSEECKSEISKTMIGISGMSMLVDTLIFFEVGMILSHL
jgi:hypothetical protein